MLEQVLQYLYKAIVGSARGDGRSREWWLNFCHQIVLSHSLRASIVCVLFFLARRYIQINSAPKIEILLCLDS